MQYLKRHAGAGVPERFADLAAEKLMLAIAASIPADSVATLKSLSETGEVEELEAFLKEHIEDPEAFVADALLPIKEALEDLEAIDHE